MKKVVLMLLVFYHGQVFADGEDQMAWSTSSSAKSYTNQDFDALIMSGNHFVKFYAPWCSHCRRLAPTWDELAEKYNVDESEVTIAKVDCTTYSSVCSNHEIAGYPTLKFFRADSDEQPVKYKGSRDLHSLDKFIQKQLGQETEEDNEIDEVPISVKGLMELNGKSFKKVTENGNHFIEFYAPWCGFCQKLAPTWEALAESLESEEAVNIAKIDCTAESNRKTCSEFEVKGYPTLLWIQDGKNLEKYEGDRSAEDLKKFIQTMTGSKPDKEISDVKEGSDESTGKAPVVVLTTDTFNNSISRGYTFVKFYAPWCGHCKRLAPTWDQLAIKMISNSAVKIAKVDCADADNRALCSQQDVSGFPTLFLYHDGIRVNEYDGNRSLDDMANFVKSNMTPEKDEL